MEPLQPQTLRPHYRAFLRAGRILLTGHSHQAWPDVARDGLLRSFDDAAEQVDEKWGRAADAADAVRAEVARRINARPDEIALGASTHDLVIRFLSALDLRRRRHLVSTAGEFHSLHRQLSRLAEAGVEVTLVPPHPLDTLAERLGAAVRPDTAALLASTVLFETSSVVPHLPAAVEAAHRVGAAVLLDAYHAFTAFPFTVQALGPDPLFVVGGGYKYAQWGEGNCFLRVPPGGFRPVVTGWFSDFEHLEGPRLAGPVSYGPRGADRFAGSTYDPASHYRAREVIRFFDQHRLELPRLRALSLRQTQRLIDGLDGFDLLSPRVPAERGAFVALRVPGAAAVVQRLKARGIFTDARGEVLRLGPAPYVTDAELDHALEALHALVPRP